MKRTPSYRLVPLTGAIANALPEPFLELAAQPVAGSDAGARWRATKEVHPRFDARTRIEVRFELHAFKLRSFVSVECRKYPAGILYAVEFAAYPLASLVGRDSAGVGTKPV